MSRFRFAWVLGASLLVATALSPLMAAPASASSSTVLVSEQTHTTSSPACTFTSRVTETLSGTTVTGLHNRASFSCPGLAGRSKNLGAALVDDSIHSAGINSEGNLSTGVGFSVSSAWDPVDDSATSKVIDVDYNHPKTSHEYEADLSFGAYLPDVTADQTQQCSQTDGWWNCFFFTTTTPASAPNVGPDPVPGPVTQTLTVPTDASGNSCQLITDLRAVDATTLSYTGRTACTGTAQVSGGGDIYVYGDRREVTLLGDATDEQCYECPNMTLSGQIPAVKGRSYTATFYISMLVVGTPPPECSGEAGSGYYDCEVSASIAF